MRFSEKEKKILVTGGAGFVGSHLCDKLLGLGHEVICLDNFYTGSRENIQHLDAHPNFTCIEHDICGPIEIEADEIYNLASPASPKHYQSDPIYTTRTSVLGALNMLELAKRTGAKILQASTSEVYGDPMVHPQTEDYNGNVNPIGMRSCYDEGKRCAETLFSDYKRMHGVEIRIARIFNTYGPRMQEDDGRVVSNFILQALRNEPLTIYGEGKQTRSFAYVDDLVNGLILLMESSYTDPINLGNPREHTIHALAKLILEMTKSSSEIVFSSLPEDDPKVRCPDITAAKTQLNWEPLILIQEGLEQTIAYFMQNKELV